MSRLFLCFVLLLPLAFGCNSSDLVSVKGKVTYNTKPVSSGTITFVSDDNASAYGDLKADGSYELMTNVPGDGAMPGSYKVIVVAMQDQANLLPEQRSPLPAPTVPIKYTSLATTDLTARVEKKDNVINFDLTGPLGK
jgi:hypothetical protein